MKELKIVVVEDDMDDAMLLINRLEKSQYNRYRVKVVDRLSLLQSALDGMDPDLVILDLGLPGSEGFETIEAAQLHIQERCPFVVYSEVVSPEVRQRALDAGACDYIAKCELSESRIKRAIEASIPHLD